MQKYSLILFFLTAWAFACSGATNNSSSGSSSSSSSQSKPVISSAQALQIIRGCCTGAGGTYSPAGTDCVLFENQSAFAGCVGTLRVKFDGPGQSGDTRTMRGEDLYRP